MLSVFMRFYQNLVLIAECHVDFDKHCSDVCCDKFPVSQTDRKSKQVKEHSDTENYICNQYREKLAILDT